ncbi:hypothetical protein GpartN1_g1341.t1 [Galdieria partita]|uniref:DUF177 domain-containing protein n=1 Tax=Galdieria partita TaxID=83374 RepID=A0A9C7UNI4_9RHOD|nr:hypothetical protein GpartN1_g1341.t1 [Galdieria partita]
MTCLHFVVSSHCCPQRSKSCKSFRCCIKTNWNGKSVFPWQHPSNGSFLRSCLDSNSPKHTKEQNRVPNDKLLLTRQQLNRCKRFLELSYHSTLEEVGLVEYGDAKEAVEIKLLIQKCGTDYLVKSRVNTRLTCECDRCLNPFRLAVEGYFQLLLASKPNVEEVYHSAQQEEANQLASTTLGFEDLEIEVWEPFTSDVEQVSLYSHVYDSIMLSLPSKILCDESCPGIPIEEYQNNVVSESTLSVDKEEKQDREQQAVGWEDIYKLKDYFQKDS